MHVLELGLAATTNPRPRRRRAPSDSLGRAGPLNSRPGGGRRPPHAAEPWKRAAPRPKPRAGGRLRWMVGDLFAPPEAGRGRRLSAKGDANEGSSFAVTFTNERLGPRARLGGPNRAQATAAQGPRAPQQRGMEMVYFSRLSRGAALFFFLSRGHWLKPESDGRLDPSRRSAGRPTALEHTRRAVHRPRRLPPAGPLRRLRLCRSNGHAPVSIDRPRTYPKRLAAVLAALLVHFPPSLTHSHSVSMYHST